VEQYPLEKRVISVETSIDKEGVFVTIQVVESHIDGNRIGDTEYLFLEKEDALELAVKLLEATLELLRV